jgi:hypothetical protein
MRLHKRAQSAPVPLAHRIEHAQRQGHMGVEHRNFDLRDPRGQVEAGDHLA